MSEENQTREQIALAAYETFMGMMAMLQTRLDLTAAKNYVSVQLHGLLSPFDRAEINFMRPGGKSPREAAQDVRRVAVACLDLIAHIARGAVPLDDPESLMQFVRDTRAKLPVVQVDGEDS